jgi:hypothetical protein
MGMFWRRAVASAWIAGAGVLPRHAVAGQVELDRIVMRVGTRVITQSDVRQAAALKLVDDVSSDAAVQAELEARCLILDEISRGTPLPPTSESQLASRRADWERRVGGAAAVPGLLSKTGMSESSLQAWLRDDLRIQAYLNRQFSTVPDGDRPKAKLDWINRLRQRAKK